MIPRMLLPVLLKLASQYPIVTIMGPRQSGKTTLIQHAFPNKAYVNLEYPDLRALARTDPRYFLAQYPLGAIFDEIQQVPELLSYLQGEVDANQTPGRFILTGSHQLQLHYAITQSLAGRTALLTLLPFSLAELNTYCHDKTIDELLWRGFFPRLHVHGLDPVQTYRDYLHTYVEKDIRQIQNIKDLSLFQRFISLCAGRIGQVLNKGSLASDLGISDKTIESWLALLEASYIIVRLQPYFENFGKRVIKSPKLYFVDVGLACYILGIENSQQLSRDPLRGFLFENMVVIDLMKARLHRGRDPNLYFYRDQHQLEVDLIYKHGHELVPIEIKVSQTFNSQFLKPLQHYQKNIAQDRVKNGYLIYSGKFEQQLGDIQLLNFMHAEQVVLMDQ